MSEYEVTLEHRQVTTGKIKLFAETELQLLEKVKALRASNVKICWTEPQYSLIAVDTRRIDNGTN